MKTTGFTVGLLALILFTLTFPFTKATAQKDRRPRLEPIIREEPFIPGRVLVKFRSNVGVDHARQIVASLGAREADELPAIRTPVLDLPEQANEAAFAHALAARADVEFAELDRIVR